MTQGYGFDKQSAIRTAQAVREWERSGHRVDRGYPTVGQRSQAGDYVMARITESGGTVQSGNTYAAVQIYAAADAALIDLPGGMEFTRAATGPWLIAPFGTLAVNDLVMCWLVGVQWFAMPTGQSHWWGEITATTANGTSKWTYDVEERVRTASGWETPANPRISTAYNANEANNDATGVQGNGVDLDSTILSDNTGIEMQPIAVGAVVRVFEEWRFNGDADEVFVTHTIDKTNAMDGECA